MKQVIVLEAMKPLQEAGKAQKSTLKSTMGAVMAIKWIRKIWTKVKKQLFITGVASGIMAFISVWLSMNVLTAVFSMCSLICFWIEDEIKEKGGKNGNINQS